MGFNISRYRKRIRREFNLEVVTPMFLGGADTRHAELRVPSLKGVLRFWWRATSGIGDPVALRKKEAEIFGDTASRARFSVSLENTGKSQPTANRLPKGHEFKYRNRRLGIIPYLSYGMEGKGDRRQHYPPGSRFTVKFVFADEKREREVLQAFNYFILLGGLGSRSRNGFGCLTTKDTGRLTLNFNRPPSSFSATSENSAYFTTAKRNYKRWEDALSAVGMAYREARLQLERKHVYRKRLLVAQPIVQERHSVPGRHAKPYFLHVGKTGEEHFGQILYMPYHYLSGHPSYSREQFELYLKVGKEMNRIIEEKLAGGTK